MERGLNEPPWQIFAIHEHDPGSDQGLHHGGSARPAIYNTVAEMTDCVRDVDLITTT